MLVLCTLLVLIKMLLKHDRMAIQREYIGNLCVATFLLNPFLLKAFISHLSCLHLYDGNGTFLAKNLNHECWTETHTAYSFLAIAGIIVWCTITPTAFLAYSYYKRFALDDLNVRVRISYFIMGFKEETSYWEFFILMRKVLITVIVSTALTENPTV